MSARPERIESWRGEEARIRAAYARRAAASAGEGRRRHGYFDQANLFAIQCRERAVLRALARYGHGELDGRRILDVGTGAGHWLREFITWGARPEHLAGVDLLRERIAEARRLLPPEVTLRHGSATTLDWPDGAFDIVLQSTVFTSILDARMREAIAAEMQRVVDPAGMILWYDFHADNPWNPDVRGVSRAEIHRLFPRCRIDLRRVTLAPPLARALVPRSWLVCELLERVPLLRTHFLGVLTRRSP
jgi:SAM-dependent methyltransferase